MTLNKARALCTENYATYSDIGRLQKKRVMLLDAIRLADSKQAEENGLLEWAFAGGFLAVLASESASGIVPCDLHLLHNLTFALNEADRRFCELERRGM